MKKRNDKSFTLILAIIACFTMLINVSLLIARYEKENSNNELANTTVELKKKTDEEKRQELIAELKTLNERSRMERYFGEYIGYIESGEYEKAYNLLYPEFRQNYLKTIDDFKKYVKETYPEIIMVSYENIERQGQYYILSVEIPKADGTGEIISQNIVLYEKDYADYYISFSL